MWYGVFPGSLVVKTQCFHFRGHGFNSWLGNQDPACCAAWQKKKKEKSVHIYYGILPSNEKEWNNAICYNVDGPGDYHTKWSKSHKERQMSNDIVYMQNIKKWYKWTYLINRNRLTDLEDEFMVTTGGKGEGWGRLGVWDWYVHTAKFKIKCLPKKKKKIVCKVMNLCCNSATHSIKFDFSES